MSMNLTERRTETYQEHADAQKGRIASLLNKTPEVLIASLPVWRYSLEFGDKAVFVFEQNCRYAFKVMDLAQSRLSTEPIGPDYCYRSLVEVTDRITRELGKS